MILNWKKWAVEYWPLVGAALCVVVVCVVRAATPHLPQDDTPTFLESAWLWSQGLGVSSLYLADLPADLAAKPEPQKLTWYAPGAVVALGLLMRAGLGQLAAYEVYMFVLTLVGWGGWLLAVRQFFWEVVRSSRALQVVLVTGPLLFTPIKDVDEYVIWAAIPWVGVLLTRLASGGFATNTALLCVLLAGCSVFCYQAVWFYMIAAVVGLFVVRGWWRRLVFLGCVGMSGLAVRMALSTVQGRPAEYLREALPLQDVVPLFFQALGQTTKIMFFLLFEPFMPTGPRRDLNLVEGFFSGLNFNGWMVVVIFFGLLSLSAWRLWRGRLGRGPAAVFGWYVVTACVLFLVMLAVASVLTHNTFYFTRMNYYFSHLIPCFYWAAGSGLLEQGRGLWRRVLRAGAALACLIVAATLLLPQRETPGKWNMLGHRPERSVKRELTPMIIYTDSKGKSKHRLDALTAPEGEFLRDPEVIIFTRTPTVLNFHLPDASGRYRAMRPLDYWQNAYSSKDVTVYFLIPDNEWQPESFFWYARHMPKQKEPIDDFLKELPGFEKMSFRLRVYRQTFDVYRARIPAGWRGADQTSRPLEVPTATP